MKIDYRRIAALMTVLCMLVLGLAGCGGNGESEDTGGAPQISGLTYESEMQLERATEYSIYHYEGGYDLIDIHEGEKFLLVPEGGVLPLPPGQGLPVRRQGGDDRLRLRRCVFFRQRRKIGGAGALKGGKTGGIMVIIEAGQIGPGTAQRVDQHGGSLLSQ